MDDIARYEIFTADPTGERETGAFWIAGSLKSLEHRARRENGPAGRGPRRTELVLSFSITMATTATLAMLLV